MKFAKLKNGRTLQFPEGATDEVIQATVKRVLGIKEEPEIEKVIRDFSEKITEKEKVDFYGPASKEQTEAMVQITEKIVEALLQLNTVAKDHSTFEKQNSIIEKNSEKRNSIFKEFIDIFKKNKVDDRELIKSSMFELSKNMVVIANHIDVLTNKMNKNTVMLVDSYDRNTEAVHELVKAYRSPKTIIRDKDGKPQTIK